MELFAEEFKPREPLAWELVGRRVPCVAEWCSEFSYRDIPLNEMIEHVNAQHGGMKKEVDSSGLIDIRWNDKYLDTQNNYWSPIVYHSDFSGHTFIPRIRKEGGIFYLYTKILADSDAASKFKVDMEVMNIRNNISLKFPGAKVYPVDRSVEDVKQDEAGFLSFDDHLAKRLFSIRDTDKTWCDIRHKTTIKKIY